ncbi:hypothetical protein GCM10022226_81820 [Sphaerisporangium flaviroseum]|uniref:PucR C-terminal helix-turn-helix domain-containing protein n=1 Tax=Sphaerisporangium flaviroseum TaxID=509199 RepID=A0ABP7JK53_9ACTN
MVTGDVQEVLEALAAAVGRGVSIDDPDGRVIAHSAHDGRTDPVRARAILSRSVPAEVGEWQRAHGVGASTGPVRVPANPELAMEPRLCVPLLHRGRRLGYLWVIEGERPLTPAEIGLVVRDAVTVAALLDDSGLPGRTGRGRPLVRRLLTGDPETRREAAAELLARGLLTYGSPYRVIVAHLTPTAPARQGSVPTSPSSTGGVSTGPAPMGEPTSPAPTAPARPGGVPPGPTSTGGPTAPIPTVPATTGSAGTGSAPTGRTRRASVPTGLPAWTGPAPPGTAPSAGVGFPADGVAGTGADFRRLIGGELRGLRSPAAYSLIDGLAVVLTSEGSTGGPREHGGARGADLWPGVVPETFPTGSAVGVSGAHTSLVTAPEAYREALAASRAAAVDPVLGPVAVWPRIGVYRFFGLSSGRAPDAQPNPRTVPGESLAVPQGSATPLGPALALPQGPVTLPGDPLVLPRDSVAPPGDPLALPRDSATLPGDPLALPRATVTSPGDPLAVPGDPLVLLREADPRGVLRETLEAYLDSGGDAQGTAEAAHLHRTSLYYRLRRIEEITGRDLRDGRARLELHLALKLARWYASG